MNDKTLAGLLIGTITVLASVIAYLFKLYVSRNREVAEATLAMIKERNEWAIERAQLVANAEVQEQELRADYEKRWRELIERYDDIVSRDHAENRRHEDQVRKEFADIMERVAAESARSSQALVTMLQKFYDRWVAPRGGY